MPLQESNERDIVIDHDKNRMTIDRVLSRGGAGTVTVGGCSCDCGDITISVSEYDGPIPPERADRLRD